MSDISVEEFLDHHGIKGQRWGVRRRSTHSGDRKEKGLSKNQKIALGVGAGTVIASGAFVAAMLMRNSGHLKVPQLNKSTVDLGKTLDLHKARIQHERLFPKDRVTPDQIMAAHNASKAQFDKWLTLKENAAGYRYAGQR